MRCQRYSNLRRAPSCSLAPALVNSPGNIRSITQDLACSVALTKRQLWEPQESWRWSSSKKWDRDGNLMSPSLRIIYVRPPARLLATGGFTAQQRNAVLVGGTGTGKTHLAIAIARSCIRAGARGRFYNVVDLVNRLETEARNAR